MLLEMIEPLIEQEPELWHRCYPRIYETPACGKYYSPKLVSAHLLASALRYRREGMKGSIEKTETQWSAQMAALRVPTYWLSEEITQAVLKTVPPVEFDWLNTRLPLEAMSFMIPKGAIKHREDDEVAFVSFARFTKGEQIPNHDRNCPTKTFTALEPAFNCFAYTAKDEGLLHWTFAPEGTMEDWWKINLADDANKLVEEFIHQQHTSPSRFAGPLNVSECYLMAKLCHFICGVILLMLAKPELITAGEMKKRVPGKRGVNEFWKPYVLGLNYRIRREWQGGTHASPRMHWVRGFYRDQPHGTGRTERKRIWVEPYLRGAEK